MVDIWENYCSCYANTWDWWRFRPLSPCSSDCHSVCSSRGGRRGMGMTDGELLRLVELPLAAGVILAGVRVAVVVSVGVATIAAAIGAGGLGVYIFRGVATVDDTLILAGALPAALLALLADGLLGLAERRLVWRPR